MKSRPHRLTVSETHHEDWVDGSWTVDCVCGVNYDDGEEMVDCDECGVWVHTRCFHFVKSEKSFYCDKCKSKNNARGVPDDSEETEVAEFLLELPTKTLRMDNPSPASVAPRRLLKLWTDVPSEDRGHVQGLPGGEPGLLSRSGMSSIFSSELWKSAGYVPKKFNFSYCDFQHLNLSAAVEKEQKELDKTSGEEIGNQADSGAGVLFSLLKENNKTLLTPAVDSSGVKSPVKCIGGHEVGSLGQKSLGAEGPDNSGPDDSINKETSSSVPVVLRSGKHRKDKLGMLMEHSVTKTVRTVEECEDARKWDADSSKGASSTFSSDVKHLKSFQGRGLDLEPVSGQCLQNVLPDQPAYKHSECATNLDSKKRGLEATPRNAASSDEVSKKESRDHVPVRSEKFSKTDNHVELLTELNGSAKQPVNEEPLHCINKDHQVTFSSSSIELSRKNIRSRHRD